MRQRSAVRDRRESIAFATAAAVSIALLLLALLHRVEIDIVEALGFVSGGACVWLAVKQNVWNWPIGIANNVFYIIVFLHSRLFADMSLQVAFAVLGAFGWYFWLHGAGTARLLCVRRTPAAQWAILGASAVVATVVWTSFLTRINDSAPFLDALTTATSLVAQYLLTRKYIENWWVWIFTDIVSIGLYTWKGLYLTAVLYALFLTMCVAGLRLWNRSLHA